MAWRGLHITQPARLRLRNRRIAVAQDDAEHAFPVEDVAWIVLDTQEATLTAGLISACMVAGIPILFSDARHMPCGLALPFHQHFLQADVAHRQVMTAEPLRKRLWQRMVQVKIENQAGTLERSQCQDAKALREMSRHVKSGDPGNVEARAARYYWPRLFQDFRRGDDEDRRNALLNYGYAVLRAAIARGLTASGLLPAFGIHHRSQQNAFNLADDLIEPFRPVVDWRVLEHCQAQGRDETELTKDDRQWMAGILSENVLLEGSQVSVLTATERAASTLVGAITEGDAALLALPVTW